MWPLRTSIACQHAHSINTSPPAQNSPLDLTNTALWVYTVAFDELRREVGLQCRDRAQLLGALWRHCMGLVEARAGLLAEAALQAAKQEASEARAALLDTQDKRTCVGTMCGCMGALNAYKGVYECWWCRCTSKCRLQCYQADMLRAQYEAAERQAAAHAAQLDDFRVQCKQLASSIVGLQQELQVAQAEGQRAQRALQVLSQHWVHYQET